MKSPRTTYFLSLFTAVLEGLTVDQAPLGFAERIDAAIRPYLRDEYQQPEPPLHEV